QEHREHFAIAEVELDHALRHGGENHRDTSMQQVSLVARSGWKPAKTSPEIKDDLHQHPHEHEHGGNAALGGVVQIDVVQMPVPAGGQGTGHVGRNVVVELQFHFLGTEAEEGMALDHFDA